MWVTEWVTEWVKALFVPLSRRWLHCVSPSALDPHSIVHCPISPTLIPNLFIFTSCIMTMFIHFDDDGAQIRFNAALDRPFSNFRIRICIRIFVLNINWIRGLIYLVYWDHARLRFELGVASDGCGRWMLQWIGFSAVIRLYKYIKYLIKLSTCLGVIAV